MEDLINVVKFMFDSVIAMGWRNIVLISSIYLSVGLLTMFAMAAIFTKVNNVLSKRADALDHVNKLRNSSNDRDSDSDNN